MDAVILELTVRTCDMLTVDAVMVEVVRVDPTNVE